MHGAGPWAFGTSHKAKEALREPLGTEGHFWRGFPCSRVVVRLGLSHIARCAARRRKAACLPPFFASFKLLAITRTLMTSEALRKGHSDPLLLSPQVPSIASREKSALRTRVGHRWSALVAFAVGRHFRDIACVHCRCLAYTCDCTNLLLRKQLKRGLTGQHEAGRARCLRDVS